MPTMLVTCPETAHLEAIEYEDDPAGMLIVSCSRFGPTLDCPRTCAARLDRRTHDRTDPEIICASRDNTLVAIRRPSRP